MTTKSTKKTSRKQSALFSCPDTQDYHYQDWTVDDVNNLSNLITNPAWHNFVERVDSHDELARVITELLKCIRKNQSIVPLPALIFFSFSLLVPDDIRLVIIGQDPYTNAIFVGDQVVPQAMGFSFSVPQNYAKPPSLVNIYKNLVKFNHISEMPETGCLVPWAARGCFMINTAFTTLLGNRNSHCEIWHDFTTRLIKYLTRHCQNLVFLVWGANAYKVCSGINRKRHRLIISSHPSPLSVSKTFSPVDPVTKERVTYPSFADTDHFGSANRYLVRHGHDAIDWNL